MRKIALVALLLFFLSVTIVGAAAIEELAWRDCVEQARQNHPDLAAAEEQVNQAKADKAIETSALFPQIDAETSARTSRAATADDESDSYAYGATAQQLIFDGFQTVNNINSARENLSSEQYNYAVTSSDIRLNLRMAFVGLLKAQELLAITEDIAARRKENVELVKLRYEAGREHKGSLLNSQANLAQAEFEVSQAKRNIELGQRQLTKELGRRQLTAIKAQGELAIEAVDKEKPDCERLAQNIPFLQALIAEKEAARYSLRSAKASFFPEVYASASADKSEEHWPPQNDGWSAGVSVSLPIFEGGSRLAEVAKARAKFKQAKAQEISGRDSVILILEETWKELQDAVEKVAVEEKFLQAAEERAKITQAQYSTGLISFDNWSIIEDNLVNARKSFLNAKATALLAQANWIQAKGGTLEDEEK
ncbi:MAG: TolC family protein [Candidatus Omnitrophota bacterium]